jgi:hypothetical protein
MRRPESFWLISGMEMSDSSADKEHSRGLVSNRTMEIAVALILMGLAAVVMIDSERLGAGWESAVGPQSGYFPFYVALIMFLASGVTLLQQIFTKAPDLGSFVERHQFALVLKVLVPTAIFVALTIYIGIYVSGFLFIAFFMMWLGKYPAYKAIPVAVIVPVLLFVIFEIWFLVPLPKGPLEAWLGY